MKISDQSGLIFWRSVSEETRTQVRHLLKAIVDQNVEPLVAVFYDNFLEHDEGASFLSNDIVHERLSASLKDWLHALVDTDLCVDIERFKARQLKIGEIHARVKIPNYLVLEGASLLKTSIAMKVIEGGHPAELTGHTLMMLDESIDCAMRYMSEAYVTDIRKRARTDEAFRLFSLGQDIQLERETQRSALVEWSQNILFRLVRGKKDSPLQTLSGSPFGMWLRHRAGLLFQGSFVLEDVENLVRFIDEELLPVIAGGSVEDAAAMVVPMTQLQDKLEEIKFLLNELFRAATDLENGRDPLTRTMNRRFLPSVIGRELSLAKKNQLPLSVMMIDVDRFKEINDMYGHAVGDIVLGQIAELLLGISRTSDYVFRYGGEEFLIILTETSLEAAINIAERVRGNFASHRIQLPDQKTIFATASIGVAAYDGHPDYEYMINRADMALYEAKQAGRNQVKSAASTSHHS